MKTHQHTLQLNLVVVLAFALLLNLTSCSLFYVPLTHNVTLFEGENELQFMGGGAVGGLSVGLDFQAAYSITDHFAVSTSGYYGSIGNDFSITSGGTTTYYNERTDYLAGTFAVGYFQKLGTSRSIFEVYAGYSSGGNRFDNDYVNSLYHFNQFYLQPSIGAHLGAADLAFSTKISYGMWSEFEELYIEPALTFRTGGEYIKFQLQIVLSYPTTGNYEREFDYNDTEGTFSVSENFHLSAGIFVPLNLNKVK